MNQEERVLSKHPFFHDLEPRHRALVAGCAHPVQFAPGEYLAREGQPANHFFLLLKGGVRLETSAPPLGVLGIVSAGAGEIVGFNWIYPPYKWSFDCRATAPTEAFEMDGRCLRGEFAQDHELGYQLMTRFSSVLGRSLDATHLQILELIHEHGTR